MADSVAYLLVLIFLVAVVCAVVFFITRFKKKKKILKSLELILYEITFPHESGKEKEKTLKELIAVMEQFYAGMSSAGLPYTLEIGLPYSGDEIAFYAAVPKTRAQLFEKQLQGVFPLASVKIKKGDYNIFRPQGFSLGSCARLKNYSVLPIRTYDKFESDPLQIIINTFSKLQKEGEGAALQIIVSPYKGGLIENIKSRIEKMKTPKEKDAAPKPLDEELLKLLEAKASRHIVSSNIRLMASSENKEKAKIILSELESAFMQFGETQGNGFWFYKPKRGKLQELFFNFCFRIPDKKSLLPLNTAELATVFHFPSAVSSIAAPQLKYIKTKESAPPLNLPSEGILIGKNVYRGAEKNIYIKNDDRRRHFYIIGQTGTGKSVLIKNMIAQDIEQGKGVCFIDPHGSDLEEILSRIPKERINDVIYFNPGDTSRPMGLNMLEYDPNYPEQKTFIVNELLGIFNKLFDMKTVGGPTFEQYFRNATMLVMEDPISGNTLLEVARVMSNKSFREYKLSQCKNPVTRSFWKEIAEKAGGETSLQNVVPYITSKFDTFLANDIMRPIISQEKSVFNFRNVLDEGKILLVNLSKGRLGDINSNLIGLIIVGKILMASFSRVDIPENQRKDFYLYIDEFQNVTTDSIATILSEARKYKLNLIIAHQYLGQLEENIKKSVFGNVGSMAAFRIGAEDAGVVEKQFEPIFNSSDLINLDNYNAYLKILIDGQTSRPFNIHTLPFQKGSEDWARQIAMLSSSRFGKTRLEVEEEINKRYAL